jgi:hypothetical protein
MRKIIIILAICASLTSCMQYKEPQSTETKGNGFQVEFLFQQDSVKVYRFVDGGRVHYFTSKGETISTFKTGKHSHIDENIQ